MHGFSLVSALFIIVVTSVAASFMLGLVGAQSQSTALGLQSARAMHASRSGLEWAISAAIADPGTCPTATFTLGEASLTGFDVAVTCSFSGHQEGSVESHIFVITSFAERGTFGDLDYTSRRLQATVEVDP